MTPREVLAKEFSYHIMQRAMEVLESNSYAIVPIEPGELTLPGARSISDTMHDTNFAARARECWSAMIQSYINKDKG